MNRSERAKACADGWRAWEPTIAEQESFIRFLRGQTSRASLQPFVAWWNAEHGTDLTAEDVFTFLVFS